MMMVVYWLMLSYFNACPPAWKSTNNEGGNGTFLDIKILNERE